MSVQLGAIIKSYSSKTFSQTVNKFIHSHWDCFRARESPDDEILANAAGTEPFGNEADFHICSKLISNETVEIVEENVHSIYIFGDFLQNEINGIVKRYIDEELTCNNFWKVYISLRSLNAKTSFFVKAICKHLSNDIDKFLACTKELFKEDNLETIAAAVELLLVPEVAHLDAVINARMIPVVLDLASNMIERQRRRPYTTAEQKFLEIIIFFIVTYIEWHGSIGDRDSNIQMLKRLPIPYRCLKTVIRATILIIKVSSPRDFDTRLSEMDQLTKSQDTIKTFMELAEDVIHPCVVAEIALKWGRSTDLTENATGKVKDIIKTLLENLKGYNPQWYNKVCKDTTNRDFLEYLKLPLQTVSSNPQALDDNGRYTPIKCIIEGTGEEGEFTVQPYSGESGKGFKDEADKCPPNGNTAYHWFFNFVCSFRYLSLWTVRRR